MITSNFSILNNITTSIKSTIYYSQKLSVSTKKVNISGNPEFGCELAMILPYAYYLHKKNLLGKIETTYGMKPFYFFTNNVVEIYNSRSLHNIISLKDVPNNWIHHNVRAITGKDYNDLSKEEKSNVNGALDYREWAPPPIKDHYLINNEINLEKKYIVICNRFNLEHGKYPVGYFDIHTLKNIFSYLNSKGYTVIYKRPENNEFPVDLNESTHLINKFGIKIKDEHGNIIDDKDLCKMYKNVILFDDLHKLYPNLSYNDFQLKLFSKSSGFIAMGGGNTLLSCYFKVPVISYFNTSIECTRENYFGKNSYYRKLSNCDFYPILDWKENIKRRGYRDYSKLLEKIYYTFQ